MGTLEKYIGLLFMVWALGAVTAFVKIMKKEEQKKGESPDS
jgi:hypothetical protein